ncbi:MAG TPA: hypothetical protein EYM97_11440 [Gemmatimonadetes bacterium]|nr:hypothetical protein [Gemmatimonadota bacterium]
MGWARLVARPRTSEGREGQEVFADNFDNTNYNRRPVDLVVLPDGSLIVTDNQASETYRICYDG